MISKELCTGCGACASICPFDAITMQPDIGGFLYPKIDNEKCKECGLCHKVCDKANNMVYNSPCRIIGLKHKSEEIRESSTSGGAFYLLASEIINREGAVYGATFDKTWRVRHARCTSLEELKILQKSKYVQSDLEESYILVNDDLRHGKMVL
ncbi:MAG: 4Fe-4S binding protein, partial [Acetivibrio ethanolgignens]